MEISREALQAVPLQVFLDFAFHLKCVNVPSLPLEMWHHILLQCSDLKTALVLLRVLPALQPMIEATPDTYRQFLSKHVQAVKADTWVYQLRVDGTVFLHILRKWQLGHGFDIHFYNCDGNYSAQYRTQSRMHCTLTTRINGVERRYWLSQWSDDDDPDFKTAHKFIDRMVFFYLDNTDRDNQFDIAALQQFFLQHFPFYELYPVNKLLQIIR